LELSVAVVGFSFGVRERAASVSEQRAGAVVLERFTLRQLFGERAANEVSKRAWVRVEISGCCALLRDMFSVKRFGVLLHSSGFTCSSEAGLDCAGV